MKISVLAPIIALAALFIAIPVVQHFRACPDTCTRYDGKCVRTFQVAEDNWDAEGRFLHKGEIWPAADGYGRAIPCGQPCPGCR